MRKEEEMDAQQDAADEIIERAKAMNKKKDGTMNYLEWSRVIDELENQIAASKLTLAINEEFLNTAVIARAGFPKPEEKQA